MKRRELPSRRVLLAGALCVGASARDTVSVKEIQMALRLSMAGDAARSIAEKLKRQKRSPLIEGRHVVFTVDTPARQVALAGVVAPDRPLPMRKLAGTTVWVSVHEFSEDARFTYHFLVDGQPLADPWNRERSGEAESVVSMPRHRLPREAQPEPGVPRGELRAGRSVDGHQATWYVPKQHGGAPVPLMVVHDCAGYLTAKLPEILDSLIARKRIPPVVGLLLDPRSREEYEDLSEAYPKWLHAQLRAAPPPGITLRDDPASRAVMGAASGGLAGFHAAWTMPGLFGRILCQSANFAANRQALQYSEVVRSSPPKPLRLCMTLGAHDPEAVRDSNHLLWGALRQHRYDFVPIEDEGFHSFDTWQQQLPRALEALWRAA
ncbi:MAG: alpha/beta hydrolase [Bryobacteraceae bacterium]